ncbi:RluA family pseudouridine synthase [Azospira restricta]|uniref:Dual-specificity RNA pseudouridine synthase RluA n=1 Tax=Azospira restricta TaxID=404405 RepID=A0A974Y5T0_9RHOO|nr:pseudouridine synthase [Azospira restricta]QRJ65673.1 RNA pseudouridine synthase [Azospira restricta]
MHSLPYSAPPDTGLDVVHADAALLVLNKPGGLLSVPGRGPGKDDCLARRAQAVYPDALIVHRLDMETSGLIVLARGAEMQRRLSAAFQSRQVDKGYVAVVDGRLAEAAGTIDLPLVADWPNRPRQKVDHELGKPSLTRWRRLAYDPAQDATRVALAPETGRSHQLRVHLLALGHPILGDALYAPPAAQAKAPRLLLHADTLAFAHPQNGAPLAFACPAPF